MERFSNKVAVITGAGSGIGAAVVAELLLYNITVVGLDVDEEKLKVGKFISQKRYKYK